MKKIILFLAIMGVMGTSLHSLRKEEVTSDPNELLLVMIQGGYDGASAKKDIKDLLASGANINLQDELGTTILHVACEHGNMNVVKCLIKNGADVTIADTLGRTAPHLAALNGHKNLIWFFIKIEIRFW